MRVYALQQHDALELDKVRFTDFFDLVGKGCIGRADDFRQNILVGDGGCAFQFTFQRQLNLPFIPQHFLESRNVPLLFNALDGHILPGQIRETALTQRRYLASQAAGIHDVVALLVNHLALVVGHVVVFEQLFTNIKVARFHLALRRFDAARHDASFNRLAIGHLEPLHDGFDAIAGKNAHQGVVQAQVKAR